jgi:C1A family cysteine protease
MDNPDVAETGIIPYPVPDERVIGGHAVLAVGYIDTPGEEQAGYFIIRNSWGPDWGVDGYGLLPYEYVERHPRGEALADDFWTLTQMTFVDLPGTRAAPYAMANWDEPRRQENP